MEQGVRWRRSLHGQLVGLRPPRDIGGQPTRLVHRPHAPDGNGLRTQFWLEYMAVDQQPVWGRRCVHRLPGRLALLSEPATLAATLATTLAATLTYVPSPTGCPRHLCLRL